jgi:hypothetical protein
LRPKYQAESDGYNRLCHVLIVVTGYRLGPGGRLPRFWEHDHERNFTVAHSADTAFMTSMVHSWPPSVSLNIYQDGQLYHRRLVYVTETYLGTVSVQVANESRLN